MLFRSWEGEVDRPWPDLVTVTDHVGVDHLVVTRHALVRQVLADPHTFRPDNALDAMTPVPVAALRILARHGFRLPPTLANNPIDLYADLAADLPLLVLARLVNLLDAAVTAVKEFARAALELFWAPVDADRQRSLAEIVGRFHAVLRDFAATGTGLVADLRAAGHSSDVVVGALFFLLVAGRRRPRSSSPCCCTG